MEYIYTAMLLHKLGKPIEEAAVRKILEAAGSHPDDGRIKALCAAMKGLDIEKAIKEAAMPVAAAPPAEAKKEEKKPEEEKKSAEAAAAGLGSLFG